MRIQILILGFKGLSKDVFERRTSIESEALSPALTVPGNGGCILRSLIYSAQHLKLKQFHVFL